MPQLSRDFVQNRKNWEKLLAEGKIGEADHLYLAKLLPQVVPLVRKRLSSKTQYDGMISLLGFTPETVALCARVLCPRRLVVLFTPQTKKFLDVVQAHAGLGAGDFYHEQFEHGPGNFDDIYLAFAKALARFRPGDRLVVEVTGGKKLMSLQLGIASAILEKQRGFGIDLCQVGYSEYLEAFRKPLPESSFIEVLEDPIDTPLRLMGACEGRDTILANPVFETRGAKVDARLVFVLMPFGRPWSDGVWACLKDAVEGLGFTCMRADSLYGEDVIEDIWKGILTASVVIADITDRNANVFYEVGIAHTIGKRVVLMTQKVEDIPFDIRRYRHLIYEDSAKGAARLRQELPKFLIETKRLQ